MARRCGSWPGACTCVAWIHGAELRALALILRAVSEMVLPADHTGISRVGGRSKMDDDVMNDDV